MPAEHQLWVNYVQSCGFTGCRALPPAATTGEEDNTSRGLSQKALKHPIVHGLTLGPEEPGPEPLADTASNFRPSWQSRSRGQRHRSPSLEATVDGTHAFSSREHHGPMQDQRLQPGQRTTGSVKGCRAFRNVVYPTLRASREPGIQTDGCAVLPSRHSSRPSVWWTETATEIHPLLKDTLSKEGGSVHAGPCKQLLVSQRGRREVRTPTVIFAMVCEGPACGWCSRCPINI